MGPILPLYTIFYKQSKIYTIHLTIFKRDKNKRQKLNNPSQEQAKALFLHRKSKRNADFWTCQFKSVHYIL